MGPKRNEEENFSYERRTNAGLRAILNEPNLVGILKSRRRIRAGPHVWRAEGQTMYEMTNWKPDKKLPIRRWINRVGKDRILLEIRDGSQLAK